MNQLAVLLLEINQFNRQSHVKMEALHQLIRAPGRGDLAF
ncbi:hypothetical protein SynBIOSU31_02238 [Synechococcus sp. BIOS-U3-1]|nr:hypothetical protein SynBIOSU31_02238 [Synechococcus sp. BIOS-U3-1]